MGKSCRAIAVWVFTSLRRLAAPATLQWPRAVLAGLVCAWIAVLLWGGGKVSLHLATIHAELRPAVAGRTTIEMPPFGAISAQTHRAPTHLVVRIDELHLDGLVDWVRKGSTQQDTVHLLTQEVATAALHLGLVALAVAGFGAALGSLLVGVRRWHLLTAVGSGVLGVMIPFLLTALTFRPGAFADPIYIGQLARAPRILQTLQTGWRRYNSLEERLPQMADRLLGFYQRMDVPALSPTEEERLNRVLLISDLHNNPFGLQLAVDLAREYRVSAVLVAGDISDLGHPVEAELLAGWERFAVPVVIVSGNHDSRAITARFARMPQVTVLDHGAVADVAGLRVMGFGDPAAERAGVGDVDLSRQERRDLCDRIREALAHGEKPEVLMVHNHRVAKELLEETPVVVTAHSHQAQLIRKDEHVLVNAGTTGAAGIRFFTGTRPVPYGAAILHFTRDLAAKLQFVDFIALDEPEGNVSIQRKNLRTDSAKHKVVAWTHPK